MENSPQDSGLWPLVTKLRSRIMILSLHRDVHSAIVPLTSQTIPYTHLASRSKNYQWGLLPEVFLFFPIKIQYPPKNGLHMRSFKLTNARNLHRHAWSHSPTLAWKHQSSSAGSGKVWEVDPAAHHDSYSLSAWNLENRCTLPFASSLLPHIKNPSHVNHFTLLNILSNDLIQIGPMPPIFMSSSAQPMCLFHLLFVLVHTEASILLRSNRFLLNVAIAATSLVAGWKLLFIMHAVNLTPSMEHIS